MSSDNPRPVSSSPSPVPKSAPGRSSAEPRPPRILRAILRALNRGDVFLAMIGDFDEEFREIAAADSPAAARRWYRRQFVRSLPGSLKENILWRTDMLKNYFLLAVRNMRRQKGLSAINILGLSIALACSLWIYLFVSNELSYNRFHTDANRLYSIIHFDNYVPYVFRASPPAVGPVLKEFFPEIEGAARLMSQPGVVQNGAYLAQQIVFMADPAFLDIFSFPLVRGNKSALADPSAIYLSRSAAARIFGSDDPMDRILTVTIRATKKDFRVAGIVDDIPSNSTIRFEALVSLANAERLRGPDTLRKWDTPMTETYVRLRPGAAASSVNARFPEFVKRHYAEMIQERKAEGTWKREGETYGFRLQNIRDIYLHSQDVLGETHGNLSRSVILGTIGILLLLVSGINFANLAAGRASRRSVEIAMRRVLGADRRNLLRQFWGESVVTVAFSMVLGLVLAAVLLPLFNSLSGKSFRPADMATLPVAGLVVLLTLAVGVLAGSYPALVLAGANPVRIFQGDRKIGGKNLFSRVLVVVQFSVAVFLLISTLVMSRQIRFVEGKDLGFNTRDTLVVDNQEFDPAASEKSFRLFRDKAASLPSVRSVGGCLYIFAQFPGDGAFRYKDKRIHFNMASVYPGYFETLGLAFKEGTDFRPPYPQNDNPIIVNETFVRAFGIENPLGAVIGGENSPYRIIGVVKDFHYHSLHNQITPVVHFLSQRVSTILVRIAPGSDGSVLPALQGVWRELRPDKPFSYRYLDAFVADKYAEDRRWNAIVRVSSALVILINCMGLIGLTSAIVGRRLKEAGIRRVLGATKASLCLKLSESFLVLGAAANLLAWPAGYIAMRRWLNGFPFRTGMPAEAFLFAGALSFLVIATTIAVLIHKTASANPAETLRYN